MTPARVSEFNESTFAFCYLHQLIATLAPLGPYEVEIPTLKYESVVGYDARVRDSVGADVFFQFKIAQERVVWSKNDSMLFGHSGKKGLDLPYRTFHIHDVNQHTLMLNHAVSSDAYYVAPMFFTLKDLWAHSLASDVKANCVEFEVGMTASVTDDDHRFVFYPTVPWWNFFSTSDGRQKANSRFSIESFVERLERRPASFAELVSRAAAEIDGVIDQEPMSTLSSGRPIFPDAGIAERFIRVQRTLRRAGIEWCMVLRERTTEEKQKQGISIRLQ